MNLLLGALALVSSLFAPVPERPAYAEGQVWEYATRAEDTGSLIKIHQIESSPAGPIYHISMTGLRIGKGREPLDAAHLPVSRETLDASVTRLAPPRAAARDFPDPREGIAIWRQDNGGVFTISLAEIAEVLAGQVGRASE